MFTFRAHRHGNAQGEGYEAHQAAYYQCQRIAGVTEIALYDTSAETAEPPRRVLKIGRQPDGIFDVVYVMNAAGKTVDTIR